MIIKKIKKGGYINSNQLDLLSRELRDTWGEMWIKKGYSINSEQLKLLSQGVRDKYLNK